MTVIYLHFELFVNKGILIGVRECLKCNECFGCNATTKPNLVNCSSASNTCEVSLN